MKTRLIFIVPVFLLSIGVGYSKETNGFVPPSERGNKAITLYKKSDLKGPKAKNYHPAKYNLQASKAKTIVGNHPEKKLQGPKAKNYSPRDYKHTSVSFEEVNTAERKNLTGPKAKR